MDLEGSQAAGQILILFCPRDVILNTHYLIFLGLSFLILAVEDDNLGFIWALWKGCSKVEMYLAHACFCFLCSPLDLTYWYISLLTPSFLQQSPPAQLDLVATPTFK